MPLPRPSRRAALKAGAAAPFAATAAALQPPARPIVEGYTDQLSYAPGDTVRFHLSGAGGITGRLVHVGGGEPV